MDFRSDESGARSSDLLTKHASTTMVELDLYDELSSFSALSPEEQRKELERVALPQAKHASVPFGAEKLRGEPESVRLSLGAQPVPPAQERTSSNLDFIEGNDLRKCDGPESDEPVEIPGVATALRCESCGAVATTEDLFCVSCGELVGDLSL